MTQKLQAGDVFSTQLPNEMYGCVRVIALREKSVLLFTSDYIGTEPPSIDDPKITTILREHRFSCGGKPAMIWVTGKPPKEMDRIGNIPPTKTELETVCNYFGGKWNQSNGYGAYYEWRWINDRPAFEEESRLRMEEAIRKMRGPQKPKKMIDENVFWDIIDRLDWKKLGNDDDVLEPAISALTERSTAEIKQFEERLAFFLYQIDTKEHASNIGEDSYSAQSGGISADGFLYVRCAAVANGRTFFEAALKDPTNMTKDVEFEALLSIASTAYERKTRREFEYVTGCSYESFSNAAKWE